MLTINIISWQLTRRCNLKCEYCFTSSLPGLNTAMELSTQECYDVIEQLKNTPGIAENPMMVLTGGEALLRKDIFDIIKKADNEGFYVVLGTNGDPLTDENIEKLWPNVRGISVNIDYVKGPEGMPQLQKAARCKKAAVRRLSKNKFPFIINTTIHKRNIDQLQDIAAWAYEQGAHTLNFFSLVPTGRGSDAFATSADDYEEAMGQVLVIQKEYEGTLKIKTKCAPHINAWLFNENPKAIRMFNGSGGCPAANGYMAISPEGDILPCPYFPVSASAGNVRKTTIEKALQTKLFKELAQRNLSGKCGTCEFSYLCSGCRARAYVLEEDYLAHDPLCNYDPKGGVRVTEETVMAKGGTVYNYNQSSNGNTQQFNWTPEAEERMKRIPPFVRSFVKSRIEMMAKAKNVTTITPAWMDKIKSQIKPMHIKTD